MLLVVLCIWIEAWGPMESAGKEARIWYGDLGYNLLDGAKF